MSVCPAAWAVPGQGSNLALILPAWGPQAAPIPSWGSSGSSAGKGGSLHPTSHSAGGDPPALTEQWDFTLPTQDAGRSWHGLGAPCQTWGCPPPSVPGAARRAAGLIHQHTTYGAGVLQTHSWGWGRRRNPGDQRAGWGAAVSGRQQSRQKTSLSSLGS